MTTTTIDQRTITNFSPEAHLLTWLEAFLVDRKEQGPAQGTIGFYRLKIGDFANFCESQAISQINQIDPNTVRQFLILLADNGHNPGGIHVHYRAIRTFLNWWEDEIEPDGWKNPIRKVKAPKVGVAPLEPLVAARGVIFLELNTNIIATQPYPYPAPQSSTFRPKYPYRPTHQWAGLMVN